LLADLRRDADLRHDVGRDREVALRGPAIGHRLDVVDEAPDLVDDDDRAARDLSRLGSVDGDAVHLLHAAHAASLTRRPAAGRGGAAERAFLGACQGCWAALPRMDGQSWLLVALLLGVPAVIGLWAWLTAKRGPEATASVRRQGSAALGGGFDEV